MDEIKQLTNRETNGSTTRLTVSKETRENTRYLFRALKALYTTKFKAMYPSDEDLRVAMQLWAIKIAPYSREELDDALLNLSETCHWVPSLAEFIAEIKLIKARAELMELQSNVGTVSTQERSDPVKAQKNIKRLYELIADARILSDHNET